MEDKFIDLINYLEELQDDIYKNEISDEEKLLRIIKYAVIRNRFFQGSIIFTKEDDVYRVSNIQKHSYAWLLEGKVIDVDCLMYALDELGISNALEYYMVSDHMNDYELSFELPKLKKRTRMK